MTICNASLKMCAITWCLTGNYGYLATTWKRGNFFNEPIKYFSKLSRKNDNLSHQSNLVRSSNHQTRCSLRARPRCCCVCAASLPFSQDRSETFLSAAAAQARLNAGVAHTQRGADKSVRKRKIHLHLLYLEHPYFFSISKMNV